MRWQPGESDIHIHDRGGRDGLCRLRQRVDPGEGVLELSLRFFEQGLVLVGFKLRAGEGERMKRGLLTGLSFG